jgi:hypothetical protein
LPEVVDPTGKTTVIDTAKATKTDHTTVATPTSIRPPRHRRQSITLHNLIRCVIGH